ncbi:hypothetical protein CS063_03245 [Sporanaerobium hydrogeniformans]|uniref:Uncharacterized protein n=1 Tax=Sporanaerobium hydrogeniformans TaxID=3072179 RepID=A0AC61DFJ1_9FIRM|nr:GDSL-type esterase/lipase family protein [Sporanaerobium hydrogeniformans]PHV71593.1 hypothetical protein CS063_03245 [Sporanaerobium hydrogeniformans]
MIKTTIIGYGEPHIKLLETYSYRLDQYLPAYYPKISWHVHKAPLKEPTTRELLRWLEEKVLCHHPNVVFVHISSKDSYNLGCQLISLNEFENNLQELVKRIKVHNNRTGLNGCKAIPILITPPPIRESISNRGRTNNRLKQYVYVIKQVAKAYDVPFIDLFNLLVEKEEREGYLLEDGLNLNQKGQDFLYDLVFIELTKLINYQGVLKDRQS